MKTNPVESNRSSIFNALLAAKEILAAAYPTTICAVARQRKRLSARVLIIACSCLAPLPPALAAPGSWTQKAEMPAGAAAAASCVVDGILYVIGGTSLPYPTPLRTVWAYDPTTDSWTRKADLPAGRIFSAAAAVDGIIYVVGGSADAATSVVAYNPKTDTWTNCADILPGRGTLTACAVDGVIYAIGGATHGGTQSSTVQAYDPSSNQWSTRSSMPQPMWFLTASVANGLIYIFQGTRTFEYDPKTDHWTTRAAFSYSSMGLMSATVDGIIYLFGGMTQDMMGSFDFALAYDPTQDRFTARRKMPRPTVNAGRGVIGGKIYLAGGLSKEPALNPDAVLYKSLVVFDPQGGVTPQILSGNLEVSNSFRLVWQAEVGIKYGVERSLNATGPWTRAVLPTGTTITATNVLVETSCTVPSGQPKCFFRVLEVN